MNKLCTSSNLRTHIPRFQNFEQKKQFFLSLFVVFFFEDVKRLSRQKNEKLSFVEDNTPSFLKYTYEYILLLPT